MKIKAIALMSIIFLITDPILAQHKTYEASTQEMYSIQSIDDVYEKEHVFNPEQELEFQQQYFLDDPFGINSSHQFRFDQTLWLECKDEVTGNYSGYRCSNRRQISVILKSFLMNHLHRCVDAGLAAQGSGYASQIHLVHLGILGDPRHAPESLHSEARAIDIKTIEVELTNGEQRSYHYRDTINDSFYSAFRKCWGEVINRYNGCPLIGGNPSLTGSIGRENINHRNHLHLSVPYCVQGQYGSGFYKR